MVALAALGLPAVALQAPAQAATTARSATTARAAASTLGPWFTWDLDDNEPDVKCVDIPHGNIQVQAYQCNGGAKQR